MNIAVIGTGYVGLVTGTCFSEMGNVVRCIDIDKKKIENLKLGILPIYEPGLASKVKDNVKAGRLHFSTSLKEIIGDVNILFIAVGTPQKENGEANLEYIYNAAKDIGKYLQNNSVIVDKSTVPVGTADKVKQIISMGLMKRKKKLDFHVVSNPEFLKEGDAINDFMRPDRVIIGTDSQFAIDIMKQLYAPFTMNHDRLIIMGIKEAELTKYAANAMLATKISFINEISNICDELNIDIEDIRKGIGSDARIGFSFIYPGAGYGGSCFPKDVKALIHTAKTAHITPMLLEAVEKRNQYQKKRIFHYIKTHFNNNIKNKIFTIWGLAFKPGTNDMREAPSLDTISSIIENGGLVYAFDPIANNDAADLLPKEWITNKRILFFDDCYDALEGSDALILMTEWKMFRNPSILKMKKLMKNSYIFDGRNQYDPKYLEEKGFLYKGIGR